MEISKENLELLNKLYNELNHIVSRLEDLLDENGFEVAMEYTHGNVIADESGEFQFIQYPTPSLTIPELCVIHFDFERIMVYSKLKTNDAIFFDYSILTNYRYDIFNSYLETLNTIDATIEELKNKLHNENDESVSFCFFLNINTSKEDILDLILLLKSHSFIKYI